MQDLEAKQILCTDFQLTMNQLVPSVLALFSETY